MKNPSITGLAEVLVVVGAINWGLVGIANLNLVNTLLGTAPRLEQLVYVLVGLSGLYWLWAEVVGASMMSNAPKSKKKK